MAAGFRRQDLLDNDHPCYVGDIGIGPNPDLVRRVHEADLLLVLGSRLSEMTTQGFSLLPIPTLKQRFIHVLSGPEELGQVYQADLPILSGMRAMSEALAGLPPLEARPWADDTAAMHASYLKWREPGETPGALKLSDVVKHLRERLPANAIITNGAGNYATWPGRFYSYHGFRTQLAPCSGSMGYGMPAALAAALVHPDRPVVCFAGDGCFQMTFQEFGTAVQYGLKNLVVLVANNNMYGTIRMHQEREYPTRVSGTEIHNPDYASWAKAYGVYAAKVERSEDFAAAFDEAMSSGGPALLELSIDPEALTTRATLSDIRGQALASGR